MILPFLASANGALAVPILPDLEVLLRMGLAVLCGLAVGLNRAHHGSVPHPNRLGVHVLVGLSACLMVLAAGGDLNARSRAIQGVATGIGFLGAGEIVVPRQFDAAAPPEVRGLSSAASIWFTASLGVTVAASSPVIALVALGLALVTLSSRLRWPQRRRPAAGGGAEDQKKHQKRKR
ncbi:MAG: MgtC/SapB family protein [Synechococcaceae cyanobacterium]